MKALLGPTVYILIILSVLQNWLVPASLLVIFFSLRFGALALIPLAVVIDGYFGHFYTLPYLSLASIVWYILIDYLRPKVLNPHLVNKLTWQN